MVDEVGRPIENNTISRHYEQGKILASIRAGIARMGNDEHSITLEDMAPVDEFHIGGRVATTAMLDPLRLGSGQRVLDVGCGIGGTARFVAANYGCTVDGIDLTPEFVETGVEICRWLRLEELVHLKCGNALKTGYEFGRFDAATMLHVGMNIPDKLALFQEVSRVLRRGGTFAIYDILRVQAGDLAYPVPWAAGPGGCAVASLEAYIVALTKAGFEIVDWIDRREYADAFFAMLKKNTEAGEGPPPLGLHLLLGASAPEKVKNMMANIAAGKITPTEIIARKL